MFDEEDNMDVFLHDTRNRRGRKDAKKRNNFKDAIRRQDQIQKRNHGLPLNDDYDQNN